jgi:hypothetical protein
MSKEDSTHLRSQYRTLDLSGLPKENMRLKKLKRWLFRRGTMPDGDAAEMLDRLRARLAEASEPLKRMIPQPAVSTLLDDEMSEEGKAAAEVRRKEAIRKYREESWRVFAKLAGEEGEAQWVRIIDRRVRDNFYSVFIGLIVGYLVGKFL